MSHVPTWFLKKVFFLKRFFFHVQHGRAVGELRAGQVLAEEQEAAPGHWQRGRVLQWQGAGGEWWVMTPGCVMMTSQARDESSSVLTLITILRWPRTDLSEVSVYGYDYDYTLASYKKVVEYLIHDKAKQHLVRWDIRPCWAQDRLSIICNKLCSEK